MGEKWGQMWHHTLMAWWELPLWLKEAHKDAHIGKEWVDWGRKQVKETRGLTVRKASEGELELTFRLFPPIPKGMAVWWSVGERWV